MITLQVLGSILNTNIIKLIPDNALEVGLIKNATKKMTDEQEYACGCFWFRKSL